MSTANSLSLEGARRTGQLDRFIREHPSKGNKELLKKSLAAATETETEQGTSTQDSSGSCNETQTP